QVRPDWAVVANEDRVVPGDEGRRIVPRRACERMPGSTGVGRRAVKGVHLEGDKADCAAAELRAGRVVVGRPVRLGGTGAKNALASGRILKRQVIPDNDPALPAFASGKGVVIVGVDDNLAGEALGVPDADGARAACLLRRLPLA